MKMSYCLQGGQATISFDAKPPAQVISLLKGHGFRWSPPTKCWWRRRVAGVADVLAAIDKALNPDRPDGQCWHCKTAPGRFRQYGASTPVLCDACNAIYREERRA